MQVIRAIPTKYGAITFRSRREADWARLFDTRGVRWAYEEEGVELHGVRYLPDLYLPELETFVEVKGILDVSSAVKVCHLAVVVAPRLVVLAGSPRDVEWWSVSAGGVDPEGRRGLDLCVACNRHQFMPAGVCAACARGDTKSPALWRWWAAEFARNGRHADAEQCYAEARRVEG